MKNERVKLTRVWFFVNFQKDKLIVNGKCIDPSQLSNKYFYNEYINVKFLKPIGINTWLRYLSINEKPNTSQLYSFIFHYLEENKLKIFRWKLLQYIIPTKKLLMKWRIAINSQCNFCGQDEDYLHYFSQIKNICLLVWSFVQIHNMLCIFFIDNNLPMHLRFRDGQFLSSGILK
jgi:hypothetical protein